MVEEAQLEETETGLEPAGGGWDFVHCPPSTEHVFVGAGTDPCVILMVGVRSDDEGLFFPVSGVARRYGASVETETDSGEEAYVAGFPNSRPGHGRRAVSATRDRVPEVAEGEEAA